MQDPAVTGYEVETMNAASMAFLQHPADIGIKNGARQRTACLCRRPTGNLKPGIDSGTCGELVTETLSDAFVFFKTFPWQRDRGNTQPVRNLCIGTGVIAMVYPVLIGSAFFFLHDFVKSPAGFCLCICGRHIQRKTFQGRISLAQETAYHPFRKIHIRNKGYVFSLALVLFEQTNIGGQGEDVLILGFFLQLFKGFCIFCTQAGSGCKRPIDFVQRHLLSAFLTGLETRQLFRPFSELMKVLTQIGSIFFPLTHSFLHQHEDAIRSCSCTCDKGVENVKCVHGLTPI